MDKINRNRNSLKLSDTLNELEAALIAWDNTQFESSGDEKSIDEPRRRAQELIEQLKSQLLVLSEAAEVRS